MIMTGLWIVLGILAVLVMLVIGTYNNLVGLRNKFKNAFAQIDVQLKRRYDLIPNLVEVAKSYMQHEKGAFEAVVNARNAAFTASNNAAANPGDPDAMSKLAKAEGNLGGALGRLFALAEAYPDLKANQNMMQLSEELTTTENRVAFARQAFNDAVMHYNTARETFPAVLFAGALGFHPAQLFAIENEAEKVAPKVSFS
jgi:LemA protein